MAAPEGHFDQTVEILGDIYLCNKNILEFWGTYLSPLWIILGFTRAFRKWHSCETQLTTVINDWAKILDEKGQVDTFILDFEKAFDTPTHELLKSKLFSYGIGGTTLNWINAFFCFRQQMVLNRIGLQLCRVSLRALFSAPCCLSNSFPCI